MKDTAHFVGIAVATCWSQQEKREGVGHLTMDCRHHGVICFNKDKMFDKTVCCRAVPMWQQLKVI